MAFANLSWNLRVGDDDARRRHRAKWVPALLFLGKPVPSRTSQSVKLPVHTLRTCRVTIIDDKRFISSRTRGCQAIRQWRDILIEEPLLQAAPLRPPLYIPMNHVFSAPIRLPEHVFSRDCSRNQTDGFKVTTTELWGSPSATVVVLPDLGFGYSCRVAIQFGRCHGYAKSTPPDELDHVWVNVVDLDSLNSDSNIPTSPCHRCPADHIRSWPHLEQQFYLGIYGWIHKWKLMCKLSFELAGDYGPLSPSGSLSSPSFTLTAIEFRDTMQTRAELQNREDSTCDNSDRRMGNRRTGGRGRPDKEGQGKGVTAMNAARSDTSSNPVSVRRPVTRMSFWLQSLVGRAKGVFHSSRTRA